ncbi:MAG TPA: 16S rRNA (cytidine(1402)-2'-O)-methyltransferase [Candidatus Angelobacter sp.]|jgi:16S rRNA (cytidine1402-2'-O)-methyltransferase|nr:16S rRNA (cytidine(1402)-2'-O)-methyltransferase [Candidatus Angelobacter sp.]
MSAADPKENGKLYVVATPIGNLEDITYRAIRILREVDLIACEDTRQTRKLLEHYGIEKPTTSYHDYNEQERAPELVAKLQQGLSIAQVSDAGMPGISDPGYRVVKLAIEQGISVVPIPGASALVSSLAASGLPTDAFEFRGFLPAKSGQRRTALETLRDAQQTVIFYEAPHRISETLREIVEILGSQRQVVIARELTKIHEEFIRGTAAEVLKSLNSRELRGEITLLIGKAESAGHATQKKDLAMRLQEIMETQRLDEKAALKLLAKEQGLSKSELYRELQRFRTKKSRP